MQKTFPHNIEKNYFSSPFEAAGPVCTTDEGTLLNLAAVILWITDETSLHLKTI